MKYKDIKNQIRLIDWDNRVQRPGFLQSKLIVSEAVCQKVYLTRKVYIHDKNNIWINSSALYDQNIYNISVKTLFPNAFKENKKWPINIFNLLQKNSLRSEKLILVLKNTDWSKESTKNKLHYFKLYAQSLRDIQKYYCLAVPLTDYCENQLKNKQNLLQEFAIQYKALDVDRINNSLRKIQEIKNNVSKKELMLAINKHLATYAWIKSNYNISGKYSSHEVLNEIRFPIPCFKPKKFPNTPDKYLIVGLQVGIYLRNRMKELSQQLWFGYERLAKELADDLSIPKNSFLQLSYQEVVDSFKKNRLLVSKSEIKARNKGFITGILNGKQIILTGKLVNELFKYFNSNKHQINKPVTGKTAYPGIVKGKVRIINTVSGLSKLKNDEILVTPMTTPDYIVSMKKARAIVTDEGGLSCHAAIIAREMKKPCIIGTKIATKIFKDGDLVEVNANKGIVKKLN